jgi:hypothetical protein
LLLGSFPSNHTWRPSINVGLNKLVGDVGPDGPVAHVV